MIAFTAAYIHKTAWKSRYEGFPFDIFPSFFYWEQHPMGTCIGARMGVLFLYNPVAVPFLVCIVSLCLQNL